MPYVYQDERNLAKAAELHTDGTYAPRVAVWTPAATPLAVAVASTPAAFTPITLLATAVRAGATLAGFVGNPGGYRGLRVFLHLTALGGGVGIGVRVLARDSVSGWGADTMALPVAGDSANAIADWAWEGGAGYPDRARTLNLMKSINMGPLNQAVIYAWPLDGANYTYGLSYEWLP